MSHLLMRIKMLILLLRVGFHEDVFEVDNDPIFDTYQLKEEFVYGFKDENVMETETNLRCVSTRR